MFDNKKIKESEQEIERLKHNFVTLDSLYKELATMNAALLNWAWWAALKTSLPKLDDKLTEKSNG